MNIGDGQHLGGICAIYLLDLVALHVDGYKHDLDPGIDWHRNNRIYIRGSLRKKGKGDIGVVLLEGVVGLF